MHSSATTAQRAAWPVAALLLTLCLSAAAAAPAADPVAGLDDYTRRAVEAWNATGLAIAVVQDGDLLFAKGYGLRELGTNDRVDEHTLFAIGSTTKAMTAAAIGMLVDDGLLAWDDPVVEHLPWFRLRDPVVTAQVRVRDLLTHNMGVPNTDFLWYEQELDTEEIVGRMRNVDTTTSMRSHFVYQNVMYATAGLVIEAASGLSWDDFLRRRLFAPLDMEHSVPLLADTRKRRNVARPHDIVDDQVVTIDNASVDNVAAAGSVWSCVVDMSKWSRFLLAGGITPGGERLLSEASHAELFRPQTIVDDGFYPTAEITNPRWTTYGLAWFQADYEGRPVDFHTGSIDGMVAIHGLLRDEDVGVIVLANRDHVEVRHALMYYVFDLFDEQPPRDWSTEMKVLYDRLGEQAQEARARARLQRDHHSQPARDLVLYAGRYQDPLLGEIEVSFDEEQLKLRHGGRLATLRHWQFETFMADWDARWRGSVPITFRLGAGRRPDALLFGGAELQRAVEEP